MSAVVSRLRIRGPLLASLALVIAGASIASQSDPWLRPATPPAPPENVPNDSRVHLGSLLFFDPRLSRSGTMSCASCHNPSLGWSDGLPTAVGFGMKTLARATPTILNTSFNSIQMWDGRKSSLEDQALGPIQAEGEMNLTLPEMIARLNAIPGYAPLFARAYPDEGISPVAVARAIASYERTVLSTESPFDRWRQGEARAMPEAAQRGFELFTDKAKCAICHMGYNFTDNGFHNIGLKPTAAVDDGRFAQKPIKSLKGAFKTPTLRDVTLTAPYMHDGSYRTLMEVVEHYDRGGDHSENLSINIVPLNLSAREKADLVAFLESLTGAPAEVRVPALPH